MIDMNLTFTGARQEITVPIPIINDAIFEDPEMFTAKLMEVAFNVNMKVDPSQANITITNDDREFFLQILLMLFRLT